MEIRKRISSLTADTVYVAPSGFNGTARPISLLVLEPMCE